MDTPVGHTTINRCNELYSLQLVERVESYQVEVLFDSGYGNELLLGEFLQFYDLATIGAHRPRDEFLLQVPLDHAVGLVACQPSLEVLEVPDPALVVLYLAADAEDLAVFEIVCCFPEAQAHVHQAGTKLAMWDAIPAAIYSKRRNR
jgi:hypothetical protein